MKEIVVSQEAPAAIGPYSHAVWSRDLLFVSGQIPVDPASGNLVGTELEPQMRQVLKNAAAVLRSAGLELEDVVKTTLFLTDMGDFPEVNRIYGESFPQNAPARSCFAVAALPKGARVEMELVASRKGA